MRWPLLIPVWREPKQSETQRAVVTLVVYAKWEGKNMKRIIWVLGLAVMTVAALALIATKQQAVQASAQATPAASAEVKIDNFSFGPAALIVAVGTTVTWVNRDDIPHTVVSTDGAFKSKVLDTDEKFSFTFSKAGSYPYFCSIHPKMTGKVVVQ
jgi:plastocyanin